MGWKIHIAEVDGTETFIDTNDLFDRGAFGQKAPFLPRFTLDLRGALDSRGDPNCRAIEPGVWLQIGVYDAGTAPTLDGHEPRRSPQCAMVYDVPLVDGDGLERLACLEFDGKPKLMRVGGGLVDVCKMTAQYEQHVGGKADDKAFVEQAFNTYMVLERKARAAYIKEHCETDNVNTWPVDEAKPWYAAEGKKAAFDREAGKIAFSMGWDWANLEGVLADYAAELEAEGALAAVASGEDEDDAADEASGFEEEDLGNDGFSSSDDDPDEESPDYF